MAGLWDSEYREHGVHKVLIKLWWVIQGVNLSGLGQIINMSGQGQARVKVREGLGRVNIARSLILHSATIGTQSIEVNEAYHVIVVCGQGQKSKVHNPSITDTNFPEKVDWNTCTSKNTPHSILWLHYNSL